MNDDTELWELERGFWLGGVAFFKRTMASNCLMVLPEPVGILRGPEIPETLKAAPRWVHISMTEQATTTNGEMVILVYRAEGVRDGETPYRALCSSTYAGGNRRWRLVQHQQTPVE